MQSIRTFARYVRVHEWRRVAVMGMGIAFGVVLVGVGSGATGWTDVGGSWPFLSGVIDVVTLVVAGAVAWGEAKERWLRQLPRRLTVEFLWYDDAAPQGWRKAMQCDDAWLAHKGDIRNWGMQLGAQMARERVLDLLPSAESAGPLLSFDAEGAYLRHTLTMRLRTLPERLDRLRHEPNRSTPWLHWSRESGFTDERTRDD